MTLCKYAFPGAADLFLDPMVVGAPRARGHLASRTRFEPIRIGERWAREK
jgi:hypothetical protein